jgi:NADPH:quinone reductase-like Zn-dependent oxidoreductase
VTRRETVDRASKTYRSNSLWIEGPERCAIRAGQVSAADGQVVVRSLFGAISRGTERLVFDGHVPPGEYDRMRAPYQDGEFPYPVKYGYAAVGVIENGPEQRVGEAVFALHPHQDFFCVAEADAHGLPDGVPPARAVLAANMETALNIVWDAHVAPGDRVAVFGAGVVGLLTAYLSRRIAGTDVTICDVDATRSMPAERLDIEFSRPGALAGEFDCLINASGSSAALNQALHHAGFESRIVEASWYGSSTAELALGGPFHAKRLSIVSSQVGSLPSHRRARWDRRRRMAKALKLLPDDRLDCLITGETPFARLKQDYAGILASSDTLCHRITY